MNFKFILYFSWYYGVKIIIRGPSYIIASLVTPLTLLFVVYVLTHGALVEYAIIGGMVTLIASVGLQSAGDATFMRLQLRIQEMYVASQVSPIDYMLSMTLSFSGILHSRHCGVQFPWRILQFIQPCNHILYDFPHNHSHTVHFSHIFYNFKHG